MCTPQLLMLASMIRFQYVNHKLQSSEFHPNSARFPRAFMSREQKNLPTYHIHEHPECSILFQGTHQTNRFVIFRRSSALQAALAM